MPDGSGGQEHGQPRQRRVDVDLERSVLDVRGFNYNADGDVISYTVLRRPVRLFLFKVVYPGISNANVKIVSAKWQNGQHVNDDPAAGYNVTGSASAMMVCP